MKKLNVMKKSSRVAIISAIASLLTIVLILSGVGIYYAIKKDKATGPKPELIVNPIEFSVDKWDGKSVSSAEFIPGYAGRKLNSTTIDSAQSFIYFIEQVNGGKTFKDETVYLNCSIDMAGYTIDSLKNFEGTFDGGYYNILNANINGNALFEQTENATIQNIGLYNCTINGKEVSAGLIKKAVNTKIQNVFVRLGEVKGSLTSGLVSEFVATAGEFKIENSFVDSGKLNFGLVGSVFANGGSSLTLENCYCTNAEEIAVGGINLVNVITPRSIADFRSLETYNPVYDEFAIWCNYDYIENSEKLSFNYPIQKEFVKVYTTGSFYNSVVLVNGSYVEDTTSLSSAFETVGANTNAEINLIVERVVVDNEAKISDNSEIKISSTVPTTLLRGENNQEGLISAISENSSVVIGNNITLDGNKNYVEANNLKSGALITVVNNNVEFGSNVVLKNNVNNQTAGGALLILNDDGSDLDFSISVENCSSSDAAINGALG